VAPEPKSWFVRQKVLGPNIHGTEGLLDTKYRSSPYTMAGRCRELPSIIANLCGRFDCSVSPPCVLVSLDLRLDMFVDGRSQFHDCKILPRILGFGAKFVFVGQKNPICWRFSIFEAGWLVGCDLVLLLGIYVTQKKEQ